MDSTDRFFYRAGIFICFVVLILAILQWSGTFTLTDIHYTCYFLSMTGFYCPGCGGTHALISLLNGDIIAAVSYHAFFVYTCVFAVIFMIWNSMALIISHINKNSKVVFFHFKLLYFYVGLGILFFQWIYKNIQMIIQ